MSATQSSTVGSRRCCSWIRAPSGSASSPWWCMRSAASASSGSRLTRSAQVRTSGTGSTKRRVSQVRKGVLPYAGSVSAVVSSVKRTACASSQSPSSDVGSTSQASSANGTRSPSRTTAGMVAEKATSPKSSSTSADCSTPSASGGVAVRPRTRASGIVWSTSASSRPHTSSRWWHSSRTSSSPRVLRIRCSSASPFGCRSSMRRRPGSGPSALLPCACSVSSGSSATSSSASKTASDW